MLGWHPCMCDHKAVRHYPQTLKGQKRMAAPAQTQSFIIPHRPSFLEVAKICCCMSGVLDMLQLGYDSTPVISEILTDLRLADGAKQCLRHSAIGFRYVTVCATLHVAVACAAR